jgi:GntR family transcriptional regulator, transcriptional repressor for pyruvate dehydrogenase complex
VADVTFERLERKPAYYTVAASIRARILSGDLPQESYLPPETDFALQLGVTRQTLREAVRLLEQSGMITRGKQRRLVVARPSVSAFGGSLREAMILHRVTYRELHELHVAIEPGMASLAALNHDVSYEKALGDNVARLAEAVRSGADIYELDVEFHALVARATNNTALRLVLEPNLDALYSGFSRLVNSLEPWQTERILEAHEHIATAIAAGDGEMARIWMTRHLEDVRLGCERAALDMEQPFVASGPDGFEPSGH